MKRALASLSLLLLIVVAAGCRGGRGPESTQEKFGVSMARMNLWREALFRFKRAVQLNPTDATAHNNLAVAYEANGDFDNAAKEYREAMRLDKTNTFIQKNYSRFVEFTSRNKKRQRGTTPATTAKTAAASSVLAPAAVPDASSSTPAPTPSTGEGPATTAQPTGTKPAAVPPDVTAPSPQPVPTPAETAPPPVKPPGDFS